MDKVFKTMGGDPRNFNKLDLYKLPSPCFVIDKKALIDNLLTLNHLKSQTSPQKNKNPVIFIMTPYTQIFE